MPCGLPSISAVSPIMPEAFATDLAMPGWKSTPWLIGTWPMCSTPQDDEDIAGHPPEWRGGIVQRLHDAGAAQAVDGDRPTECGMPGQQRGVAGDVEALLQGLLHAAPVDIPRSRSGRGWGCAAGWISSGARSSSARTLRKAPPLDRPIGVRIQSTMTTSFMNGSPFRNQ